MRILFVDDEPNVLDGIRRMLRAQSREWEMHFAEGGEAAIETLRTQRFDVVVTDMRMPQMDGATLLQHVRREFPDVVRIVLSGQTQTHVAMRTIPYAHQFLTKPCEAGLLRDTILRTASLRHLLSSEGLLKVIGQMEALPALPSVYSELRRALEDADASQEEIAKIVERDIGISSKILQIVNSSFIGLRRHAANLREAVAYLGTSTIRGLVLAAEVFQVFQPSDECLRANAMSVHEDGLLASTLARKMIRNPNESEFAFVSGLMHDVGKLVLVSRIPDAYRDILEESRGRAVPQHVVERERLGVCHAEVGAYLLGLWGFPDPIVEAVAHHHAPQAVPGSELGLAGVTHLVDLLLEDLGADPSGSSEIDDGWLESLGVLDQLGGWRALAAEVSGREAA